MKKIGSILLVIVLFSMVSINADEKVKIVCTTTILETFAKEIGGEKVEVISLVQPGVCPAHFDMRPSNVYDVSEASLILYHGFEPWLDDLINSSGNRDVKKVLLKGSWSTPDSAIQKIEEIKNALSEVSPENAEYFDENADKTIENIRETAESIKKEAESIGVRNIDVICMEWQKEFVEWIGFNIVATYGPPEKVSMKDVNEITKKKAVLVIDNLQSGTKLGSQIASEIGAYHVILTNFPNAVPETETFSEMMEYNADHLFNAVKSESETPEESSDAFKITSVILAALCAGIVVLYLRKR